MDPLPTNHDAEILWRRELLEEMEKARKNRISEERKQLQDPQADVRVVLQYRTLHEVFVAKLAKYEEEVFRIPRNLLSQEEVKDAWNKADSAWWPEVRWANAPSAGEGVPERKALEALKLGETIQLCVPINRIICFGLGSMTEKGPDGKAITRRFKQHLAVIEIARSLWGGEFDRGVPELYFADPLYTADDKYLLMAHAMDFINKMDVSTPVIDDARAFIKINESTLVICFGADWPIREIVADRALAAYAKEKALVPAAIICRPEDSSADGDAVTPRVEWMLKQLTLRLELATVAGAESTFGDAVLHMRART